MRDSKYSILFMRDDTDVRRFRVSQFWLRGYVVAQIVLIVLTVVSLYIGITSWNDNTSLTNEKKEMAAKLKQAELSNESLENMVKLFESNDVSTLALLAETMDSTDSSRGTINLTTIFTPINTGIVEVDEVKASLQGTKLTVNFKVENPKPDTVLTGKAKLALVTSAGIIHVLEASTADLAFQIQRRKFARTTVDLPKGVTKENAFGLRISIQRSDGTVIFSETYPLYRILS